MQFDLGIVAYRQYTTCATVGELKFDAENALFRFVLEAFIFPGISSLSYDLRKMSN